MDRCQNCGLPVELKRCPPHNFAATSRRWRERTGKPNEDGYEVEFDDTILYCTLCGIAFILRPEMKGESSDQIVCQGRVVWDARDMAKALAALEKGDVVGLEELAQEIGGDGVFISQGPRAGLRFPRRHRIRTGTQRESRRTGVRQLGCQVPKESCVPSSG
jgi:hypothetical protein